MKGVGGRKIGNAHLKWAFAEAASLMLRSFAPAKAWLMHQLVFRNPSGAMLADLARFHRLSLTLDLPQTQAKSLDQDKEPLTVSVNTKGEVFLQNSEIKIDELVPKLQAVTQARGGTDERIYVRGDKKVDYGTVIRVMRRLSAAGYRRVALVTEVEQGS